MSDGNDHSTEMRVSKATSDSNAPDLKSGELALQSYRFAAAVLSTFNPVALRPMDSNYNGEEDAVLDLLEECERVQTVEEGWQWTLRNSFRRHALIALGKRSEIKRALLANSPRPQDTLQRIFEAAVEGTLPRIEQQTVEELTASVQVLDWLEQVIEGLPNRQDAIDQLEWQQFLQPFRQLVGEHFRGREDELAHLHHYVASSGAKRSIYGSPPLMIYGTAGVGKSTLLSKFILETVDEVRVRNFAFVYWDFDRVTLLPEEPVTLLAELIWQLGLQLLPLKPMARELRRNWLEELADSAGERSTQIERGVGAKKIYREAAQRGIIQSHKTITLKLFDLRRLVTELPQAYQLRLVLVLDTFERVQELSFEFTRALWDFLNDLQPLFPYMRVIVSGRVQLDAEIAHEPFELKELDEEAAKGYVAWRGVSNPKVTTDIYKRVGGDPLSLRLALDSLQLDLEEKHEDLASLTELPPDFAGLGFDHELNQNWLYRRYLNKIRDPEIQRLAHPGLTLRRVTPALIRAVLAKPCDVDVPSDDVAEDLFERLANQISLVKREGPWMLRHRPDIRKRMLRALIQTEGDTVFEIHQRAVDFYTTQPPTPEARAEEIYHRLFLAQSHEEIDKRWINGVVILLRDAVDEIPLESRGYLIAKLGTTASGIALDWNEADARSREAFVATRVQDALAVNRPSEALQLLSEIRDRLPGSKLFRLEAQTLESLGRYPEALNVANEGLFSARQAGDVLLQLDLLFVALRANEKLGHFDRAADRLTRIRNLNLGIAQKEEWVQEEVLALEILMHRLRLCRLAPDKCDREPSTVDQAFEAFTSLFDMGRRSDSGLLLDVAEEIGVERPEVISLAVTAFSSTFTNESNRRQLAVLVREWGLAQRRLRSQSTSTLANIAQLLDTGKPGQVMEAVGATAHDDWPDFFRQLLASHSPTQSFVSGLIALLRGSLSTSSQPGTLTATLLDQVAQGLFNSFETIDSLMAFLQAEFPEDVANLTIGNSTYNNTLVTVATLFERQGKTEELIERVLSQQPENRLLQAVLQQLAVAGSEEATNWVTSPGDYIGTGDIVGSAINISTGSRLSVSGNIVGSTINISNRSIPRDVLATLPKAMPLNSFDRVGPAWASPELVFNWALGMRQAMRAVCRVALAETLFTGFLVAPNLVLIPSWVIKGVYEKAPKEVIGEAIFDKLEAADGTAHTTTTYILADDWLVAKNDRDFGFYRSTPLGYALVRLKGSPGYDQVPGEEVVRSWLSLTPEPVPAGRSLAMLHHAESGPQKLEFAQAQSGIDGGQYIEPFSPFRAPGASGAPCFNEAWEVIAIRQGVDFDVSGRPSGRPMALIALWARDLLADPIFTDVLKEHLPEIKLTPEDKAVRLAKLQALLNEVFSFEELESLSIDLGVDVESLPGTTRSEKVRELVNHMEERNQLEALIQRLAVLRPRVNWRTEYSGM